MKRFRTLINPFGDLLFCTFFYSVINHLPDLETLVLDHISNTLFGSPPEPKDWFHVLCPRLTSFSLWHLSLEMTELELLFSQTPSLRHFKFVIGSHSMIDGSQWEYLIKTKVPALDKLEFHISVYRLLSENKSVESVLSEMIAPFRTPFWTTEKRWHIICNVLSISNEVEKYTSPICRSPYMHEFGPTMKSISNFERENYDSTVLEIVNELHVDLDGLLADDRVSHLHHCSALLSVDRMCLYSRCSITVGLVSYLDCEANEWMLFRSDRSFNLNGKCVSSHIFHFHARSIWSDETIAVGSLHTVTRSNQRRSFHRFAQENIESSIIDNGMDSHFQKRSIRCREGLFHNPHSSQSIEVAASEHSDVQSQSCQNDSGQIPASVQSHIVFSDRIHPFWTDLRLFPGIVALLFNSEEPRVNIDLVGRKIREEQRSQTHQIVLLTRRFVICSSLMISYRSHTNRCKTVRSFLSSIWPTEIET